MMKIITLNAAAFWLCWAAGAAANPFDFSNGAQTAGQAPLQVEFKNAPVQNLSLRDIQMKGVIQPRCVRGDQRILQDAVYQQIPDIKLRAQLILKRRSGEALNAVEVMAKGQPKTSWLILGADLDNELCTSSIPRSAMLKGVQLSFQDADPLHAKNLRTLYLLRQIQ